MSDDSALWAWFVFNSGLPTQRAKALLEDLEEPTPGEWDEEGPGESDEPEPEDPV